MELTRETIEAGTLERLAASDTVPVLSKPQRDGSRRALLRKLPHGADVWVFAYGSLIWNPAFRFVERRTALLHGFHRRFCLWTCVGRGTAARPGLVLGLDRGGACRGVVYRIAARDVDTETDAIWAREMTTTEYLPCCLPVRTADGTVPAIAFVMDRRHDRYAGRLSEDRIAAVIATAAGHFGSCRDYLSQTVTHLEALGIADAGLQRLQQRVLKLSNQSFSTDHRHADDA